MSDAFEGVQQLTETAPNGLTWFPASRVSQEADGSLRIEGSFS